MSLTDTLLCAAIAIVLLAGTATNRDTEADQATADMVADRQAELVALRQEREVPRRKSAYQEGKK